METDRPCSPLDLSQLDLGVVYGEEPLLVGRQRPDHGDATRPLVGHVLLVAQLKQMPRERVEVTLPQFRVFGHR